MKTLYLVFAFTTLVTVSQTNAQEITTFPGFWGQQFYQDDSRISKKQVASLMNQDPEANQLWQKSQQHMNIGWIAFGAEFGFLLWQLNRAANNDSQTLPLIGVIGSAGVAIGFALSSNSLQKKAILKYNSNTKVSTLNLGLTHNGVGLVYQF